MDNTLTVPLFPLPNIVLFPGMLLPLHVFEPRYKEMIGDIVESGEMLGVVQLRPGWEQDYYGNPPIYRNMGIGEIIKSRKLEDGRFDILVQGKHRVHVLDEGMRGPYRVAHVRIREDFLQPEHREAADQLHRKLLGIVEVLLDIAPAKSLGYAPDAWEQLTAGVVSDVLANMVVDDAYEKQSILDECNLLRRLQLVEVQLRSVLKPWE